MKSELKKLRARWDKRNILPTIESSMKFPYEEENRLRNMIAEALELWYFSMNNLNVDWEVRRAYLNDFVEKNSNPFVRLVAMIEMLPTTVWRAILGEYNMDYMSAEAFLRRMTSEQETLIRQNYEELFANCQIPSVLSQRRCFKNWTVEGLLQEEIGYRRRYASRAAISYNLLNLDFGYNAYPEGTESDTKIMGQKSLGRFLSMKNHVNDFSVNQDYGRYWWLYKTARSNYIWKSNHRVYLKDHICPGFWYTMLIHLLFWIVSPLADIGLIAAVASEYFPSSIVFFPTLLIAAFTPVWGMLAGIKYLAIKFLSSEETERIRKWTKEKEELLQMILLTMIIIAGAGLILYCTWSMFDFLQKAFNEVAAIWLILMIYVLAIYSIYFFAIKDRAPRFKDFPLYLRVPLYATAVGISSFFSAVYSEEIMKLLSFMAELIILVLFFNMGIIKLMGLPGLLMALLLLSGPALWLISKHLDEEKKERLFYFVERFAYITIHAVALCLFVLVAVQIVRGIFFTDIDTFTAIGSLSMAAIVYVLFAKYWQLALKTDPKIAILEKIVADMKRDMKHEFHVSIRSLQRNKWFRTLNQDQQLLIGQEIRGIVTGLFHRSDDKRDEAFGKVVSHLNEKTIPLLREYALRLMYSELKFKLFCLIVKANVDFETARGIVEKREAQRKKVSRLVWGALKIIFFPLVILWKITNVCKKFVVDLIELIRIFNKMCPYVVRSKPVQVVSENYDVH